MQRKIEKREITLQQLKNKVLRLLSKRDHSVSEIKKKLKQYYVFEMSDFDIAVEWLRELKYLTDEKVLAARLSDQWRKQGRGRKWISGKLATKGLKDATLKDDEPEHEAALVFIEKKIKNRPLSDFSFEEKQALRRKMLARGFSHTVIRDLVK